MLKRVAIVMLIGLYGSSAFLNGGEILFMQQGGNPDFDDQLIEYIESLGHDVTPFDAGGDPDGELQIEEAMAADLVYITESLGSTSVHDGFETYLKEIAVPQIWAEAYAWDEAAITGDEQFIDFGNTQRANIDEEPEEDFNEGQTAMHIIAPNHPLAGGFSGEVEVYEDVYSFNWGLTETLGAGAEVIAALTPEGKYATLFTYDKGAELEDGSIAPEKRVGFWLGQAGIGAPLFDNLNENGLKLIEAAIDYGLGLTVTGPAGDFNSDGLVDLLDINLLTAQVASGANDAGFDLTMDGMVNDDDRTAWVKDAKFTWFGDSNLDGEFNSADFVAVFQTGKFETADAADWAEGDWNGDGLFTSSDFVSAFQDGGFEIGPRQAANAVPEPTTSLLVLLGLLGFGSHARRMSK